MQRYFLFTLIVLVVSVLACDSAVTLEKVEPTPSGTPISIDIPTPLPIATSMPGSTATLAEKRIVVPSGELSELREYPMDKEVFVRKRDGTVDQRPNDLEELCKDWLYYRKKVLEHEAAGRTEKAAEARSALQEVNEWLDEYDESDVQAMFDILERMGYEPP